MEMLKIDAHFIDPTRITVITKDPDTPGRYMLSVPGAEAEIPLTTAAGIETWLSKHGLNMMGVLYLVDAGDLRATINAAWIRPDRVSALGIEGEKYLVREMDDNNEEVDRTVTTYTLCLPGFGSGHDMAMLMTPRQFFAGVAKMEAAAAQRRAQAMADKLPKAETT